MHQHAPFPANFHNFQTRGSPNPTPLGRDTAGRSVCPLGLGLEFTPFSGSVSKQR